MLLEGCIQPGLFLFSRDFDACALLIQNLLQKVQLLYRFLLPVIARFFAIRNFAINAGHNCSLAFGDLLNSISSGLSQSFLTPKWCCIASIERFIDNHDLLVLGRCNCARILLICIFYSRFIAITFVQGILTALQHFIESLNHCPKGDSMLRIYFSHA